jgi:Sulfotransferase family
VTITARAATAPAERSGCSADGHGRAGDAHGPILVLTYAHAGHDVLTDILARSRSVTCTSNTGLLPLCHAAAATWQRAENHTPVSRLALKSIRAMAGAVITVIQTDAGCPRWCETTFASSAAAAIFLEVFPTAQFLCLHRGLEGVLDDGVAAYPWGMRGSPFWQHSAGNAGNTVAMVASYWASCTRQLLEFERQQPEACLRISYEMLVTDVPSLARRVYEYLGLDLKDLDGPRVEVQSRATALGTSAGTSQGPAGEQSRPRAGIALPADLIPPGLRAEVAELHCQLDLDLDLS